ncbi:hypothetical protein QQY66_49045 [Streptomyces sp. DG2A-72]|uniref:hypothetical protein n=1 Tax=Streptomyces sp. DG2A-72 TaxID=3051386 RepID=UPI00265C6806|nr:hypothetical protein [Streptomyces sp. DG2A-72]MDO0939261.1 hypothetical protein [Streptomyces sp. DG2A-72]
MKPTPETEITGTATRFNLEGDSKGAVLVVYTEDDNGKIGRSWIRFDEAATRALKSRAATLPDFPAEETAPAEDVLASLPSGFTFGGSAPVIGGGVVLGDVHGVSGGVVYGDVHLGGRPSGQ